MSQFSMAKIHFFSEKLGTHLTNREAWGSKRKFCFSFVKKQQRQKFQPKKVTMMNLLQSSNRVWNEYKLNVFL